MALNTNSVQSLTATRPTPMQNESEVTQPSNKSAAQKREMLPKPIISPMPTRTVPGGIQTPYSPPLSPDSGDYTAKGSSHKAMVSLRNEQNSPFELARPTYVHKRARSSKRPVVVRHVTKIVVNGGLYTGPVKVTQKQASPKNEFVFPLFSDPDINIPCSELSLLQRIKRRVNENRGGLSMVFSFFAFCMSRVNLGYRLNG